MSGVALPHALFQLEEDRYSFASAVITCKVSGFESFKHDTEPTQALDPDPLYEMEVYYPYQMSTFYHSISPAIAALKLQASSSESCQYNGAMKLCVIIEYICGPLA